MLINRASCAVGAVVLMRNQYDRTGVCPNASSKVPGFWVLHTLCMDMPLHVEGVG
jgi:hypothetical protein